MYKMVFPLMGNPRTGVKYEITDEQIEEFNNRPQQVYAEYGNPMDRGFTKTSRLEKVDETRVCGKLSNLRKETVNGTTCIVGDFQTAGPFGKAAETALTEDYATFGIRSFVKPINRDDPTTREVSELITFDLVPKFDKE